MEGEDFVAWNFEKNGIFSVRSAYKALEEKMNSDAGKSSVAGDGSREVWNLVWFLLELKCLLGGWRQTVLRFRQSDFVITRLLALLAQSVV